MIKLIKTSIFFFVWVVAYSALAEACTGTTTVYSGDGRIKAVLSQVEEYWYGLDINVFDAKSGKKLAYVHKKESELPRYGRCFYKAEISRDGSTILIISNDFRDSTSSIKVHFPNLTKQFDLGLKDAYKNAQDFESLFGFLEKYDKKVSYAEHKKMLEEVRANLYNKVIDQNDLNYLFLFLNKYAKPNHTKAVKEKIQSIYDTNFLLAKKNNTFLAYQQFIEKFPNAPQIDDSISMIYRLVEKENNIAGYHWFLDVYPKAPDALKAMKRLHSLAFEFAQQENTLEAYNDFVIAYPIASEVKEANRLAYDLEKKKYSGFFFFSSDEKNSRALLVKSKQMERKAKDQEQSQRSGYWLVINRMNDLLQEKFPAEDATLRYLESEEFKAFYEDFKRTMTAIDKINETLRKIDSNTQDLSKIIKEQAVIMNSHFRGAAESQAQEAKYAEQHRFWERYMKKNE